jgi:nucleotide-binding universal stress UspA family protein
MSAWGNKVWYNIMNRIINFERILCPVVPSAGPDDGLYCALALARLYGAKLFVCYYTDEPAPVGADCLTGMREAIKKSVELSLDLFPTVADTAHLDWEPIVAESSRPAEVITREAAARNIDLIVMSSRRRPYAAALLGSTAETVCLTAPCPVLVTRSGGRPNLVSASRDVNLKRVLVAYDFSSGSELAFNYGLSIAQEYQSELHLLHVISAQATKGEEISWDSPDDEGPYHKAARGLQQLVPAVAHLWCEITHAVREGKPYQEILSYAVEQQIDLICIGAHGKGFQLGTLFGTNVDRVLRESPCPVMVVRPLRPDPETLDSKI